MRQLMMRMILILKFYGVQLNKFIQGTRNGID